MNLHCTSHGSSCSSTVRLYCCMKAFWQFSTKLFQGCEASANSSCKRFLCLSIFNSKRRNLMISRNLFIGIVCENIGHPHDFPHKLFTGKLRPPITLQTTTKPMNLSSSCRDTFQVGSLAFVFPSATVHFCMFLSIASSKNILNNDTGLPEITRLVAYDVGPGRNLRILCDCRHPWEAFETGIFFHLVPSCRWIMPPCATAWLGRAGGSGSSSLESDDDNSNSPTAPSVEFSISLVSLSESSSPEQSEGRSCNIARPCAAANLCLDIQACAAANLCLDILYYPTIAFISAMWT